jgi:hypothetical protein
MTTAVVAKAGPRGLQFLTQLAPTVGWSATERQATRFADVRSATRTALRLTARHRAFALPTGAGQLRPI